MYAIAYQLTSNLLVLWPLLTPLGSFHANVEAREVDLPWASIAGFLDVAAVMITVLVVAHRHQRRAHLAVAGTTHDTSTQGGSNLRRPTPAGSGERLT